LCLARAARMEAYGCALDYNDLDVELDLTASSDNAWTQGLLCDHDTGTFLERDSELEAGGTDLDRPAKRQRKVDSPAERFYTSKGRFYTSASTRCTSQYRHTSLGPGSSVDHMREAKRPHRRRKGELTPTEARRKVERRKQNNRDSALRSYRERVAHWEKLEVGGSAGTYFLYKPLQHS
jgi:hypothetical protein